MRCLDLRGGCIKKTERRDGSRAQPVRVEGRTWESLLMAKRCCASKHRKRRHSYLETCGSPRSWTFGNLKPFATSYSLQKRNSRRQYVTAARSSCAANMNWGTASGKRTLLRAIPSMPHPIVPIENRFPGSEIGGTGLFPLLGGRQRIGSVLDTS